MANTTGNTRLTANSRRAYIISTNRLKKNDNIFKRTSPHRSRAVIVHSVPSVTSKTFRPSTRKRTPHRIHRHGKTDAFPPSRCLTSAIVRTKKILYFPYSDLILLLHRRFVHRNCGRRNGKTCRNPTPLDTKRYLKTKPHGRGLNRQRLVAPL